MLKKIAVAVIAVLVLSTVHFGVAQSPTEIVNNTFELPADICYTADGLPVIIDSSFGNYTTHYNFSYMRNDGVIITIRYAVTGFNTHYSPTVFMSTTGGKCPTT